MTKDKINKFIYKNFNKNNLYKIIKKMLSQTRYKIAFGIIFTLFFSLFLTTFIFKFYFDYDMSQGYRIFANFKRNTVFQISYLIILIIVTLIISITGKFALSYMLSSAIMLSLLSASHAKFDSRNMPLLPEDFRLALTGLKMTSVINEGTITKIIFNIIVLICFSVALLILVKKITNYPKNRRVFYPVRVVLIVLCLFGLSEINYSFKYSVNDNNWSALTNTYFVSWNQYKNYHRNGPIAGFMYNIGGLQLSKPKNYSKEEIEKVVNKYKAQAQIINAGRTNIKDKNVDIVYILSESLIDPMDFTDKYNIKKDPMPRTRDLMNRISSGRLATSEYGGGTANVEFEILTGLTNMLTENATPYTHLIPKRETFPSIARQLKNSGFKATSLHAFDREMYKRNVTYPILGFDNFIGDKKMKDNKPIEGNQYISDEDFFNEIILQLDQEPEKTHFIHTVSMQNHAPYIDLYPEDKNIWVEDETTDEFEMKKIDQYNNYLKGVSYSDVYLNNFIEKISKREKPTIVVLWGDHIPGHSIMRRVDSEKIEGHKTPLFIYTNFETPRQDLKIMSGNFINNKVLEILNTKISPFQAMLLNMEKEYPAMTIYHVKDKKKLGKNPTFKDYKLIQYDLLAGKGYSKQYGFFDSTMLKSNHEQ